MSKISAFGSAGRFTDQSRHFLLQQRQVIDDNVPHQGVVDAPVTVDQAVTERNGLAPRHTIGAMRRRGQPGGGLADHLEIPNDASWISRSCRKASRPPATKVSIAAMLSAMCARYGDRISHRSCLRLDERTKVRAEAARQKQIEMPVQQRFQFLDQTQVVAKAAIRVEFAAPRRADGVCRHVMLSL